jgi:dihydroorotate dehydrogenase electron transfer subunit
MRLHEARVARHEPFGGEYRVLELAAPELAASVQPGQFVHLRVPRLEESALRRPFSVFRARPPLVAILYKQVGRGTGLLTELQPGATLSVLGPLGNGFPLETAGRLPVLVAGGYGVAPLSFLAERLDRRGILFAGGRGAPDILCEAEFRAMGWDARVTTEDGSLGTRGRVTDALDPWLADNPAVEPVFYACGPDGLLRAVGERAMARGCPAWLSLDKHMGCGVGACLACVQRVRDGSGAVKWARVCRDGPVFECRRIVWPNGSDDGPN